MLAPAAQAAFPGRNGDIAYVAPGNDNGNEAELWTVDPSSGAVTELAQVFVSGGPASSDDGRTLAFSAFIGRQGNVIGAFPGRRPAAAPWNVFDMEMMTVPSVPTGPGDAGDAEDFDPAWAPGGRHIVYRDDAGQVIVLGADGSKRVIATGANVDGPAWSPDGRLIRVHPVHRGLRRMRNLARPPERDASAPADRRHDERAEPELVAEWPPPGVRGERRPVDDPPAGVRPASAPAPAARLKPRPVVVARRHADRLRATTACTWSTRTAAVSGGWWRRTRSRTPTGSRKCGRCRCSASERR